jgi:hypothetical protein
VVSAPVFRVRVRHNVVCGLDAVPASPGLVVPDTKLEVSTQLARQHQIKGCIDGDYHFADIDTAKYFAVLCQDFVKRLIDKTLADLERLRTAPDETWRNPLTPSASDPIP